MNGRRTRRHSIPLWFCLLWGFPSAVWELPAAGAWGEEESSSFEEALWKGRKYLENRQIPQAIDMLKKAIAFNPRSAEAHMILGYAYRVDGSYELLGEAKAELRQALALEPGLIWARYYLGQIYLDFGRLAKAKEELERILKDRPDLPEVLALLGEVDRQLGNPESCVAHNRRALELGPGLTAAHYYLGLAYRDLGREKEALRELETAAASEQIIPDIHLALGSIHLEAGRADRAIELLSIVLKRDPARAEGRLKLARAYRLKGLEELALQELERLREQEGAFLGSAYFQELRAQIHAEMGSIYQERGARGEAIDSYSRSLALDPEQGTIHRQVAEILLEQREYERAIEHAVKAEELGAPLAPDLLAKIKSHSSR